MNAMKLNTQELENELRSYWKKDDMVKHCMKNHKYIKIGEWFVNVCDAKPTITTTIWYDDETEGPENNKETFMRANNRHTKELPTDRKYFIAKNWYRQTDQKLAAVTSCKTWEEPSTEVIRELTPEEMILVHQAVAEVNADFQKRLETYYKRYSNKISVSGYWVNR